MYYKKGGDIRFYYGLSNLATAYALTHQGRTRSWPSRVPPYFGNLLLGIPRRWPLPPPTIPESPRLPCFRSRGVPSASSAPPCFPPSFRASKGLPFLCLGLLGSVVFRARRRRSSIFLLCRGILVSSLCTSESGMRSTCSLPETSAGSTSLRVLPRSAVSSIR